jgi:SWI/SNF chromatin-remodeling complex subunit SWI1
MLADMALEVFTRISQSDVNRQFLARAIPQRILWQLVTSLVHRVPMIEADFLLMQRDYWQSYVEKTIMGIYSLIFMAPYELKQKIKADKRLGIKTVLLRMAQRVLLVPNHDGRGFFVIPARRAVEAMKLLDKAEEKLDAAEPAMPALQFGMGFDDGDDKSLDKGTGLLGANKDVAWEMLMMREVFTDEVFFNELDSLVRVDCP